MSKTKYQNESIFMKKLGIDVGVASIGWAFVESNEKNNCKILGMGSRIIPLNTDDKDEFSSGNAISKNQKRTQRRTQRKGFDRYQLRRFYLKQELEKLGMSAGIHLFQLSSLDLYALRDKALKEQLTLEEIGRLLLHLNQKRGYKSNRKTETADKKETEYVAALQGRYAHIRSQKLTVGQYFYQQLQQNGYTRLKEQVFPRDAYEQEYNAIMSQQAKFYPNILTSEVVQKIRDEIIFYQRKPKSQKGLVSICEFAGRWIKVEQENGAFRPVFTGPKVAPRSSPLFQVCKIWETVNNLTLRNKRGEIYETSEEQKQLLFEYLDNHEKMTQAELFKLLNLSKEDGWYGNKMIDKGLQGNTTKMQILSCLDGVEDQATYTEFNLSIVEYTHTDTDTGDMTSRMQITSDFEKQPLYELWHLVYSVSDREELIAALKKRYALKDEACNRLARLDFTKSGFGNKSARAIRRILPYLQQGLPYSEACALAGYNHSDSLTKDENHARPLLDRLENLPKNSLRQPVVEKILNQLINLVNAIIAEYGRPDEIRIELARELKQSKEERNNTFKNINKREKENKIISDRITKELGLRATKRNIDKWRLFEEVNGRCLYCNKGIERAGFLLGDQSDVEHIIPKARLFDDSMQNKIAAHRKCNSDKGNRTAYDFMRFKSDQEFYEYIQQIDVLYKEGKISRSKRDKLLMPEDKIPKDFIERQLRETQYISRKAKEILSAVCHNVYATSGSVTDYLRHAWGWDEVLMNLQLDRYREVGLTEWKEFEYNGQLQRKEVIKGWSKRKDNRHHAIDALAVACTTQGIIQRLSNLNQLVQKEAGTSRQDALKGEESLKRFVSQLRPFTTKEVEEAAAGILISMKAGKKVASIGTRKALIGGKKQVVQDKIVIPRGPLSEESIYGKIKIMVKNVSTRQLFENSELIVKERIRIKVLERLAQFENDVKKAIASLKKEPIYLDADRKELLEFGTIFKEEYVIKYPLSTIKYKDVDSIVDKAAREAVRARLDAHGKDEKEALRDLVNHPVFLDAAKTIPIRSVRCLTGLSAVEPVRYNQNREPFGYVKPGNNHHIAFYLDQDGVKREHAVTFWHAVERRKFGLPVVIRNPAQVCGKTEVSANNFPESFLNNLPLPGWSYSESLQQNEMFVLGMLPDEWSDAMRKNDIAEISRHLYRVQKLGSYYYVFRHHLETELDDSQESKLARRFLSIRSIKAFEQLNPIKVSIDLLGKINSQW
ncbi:MAG TPA: type II CRISPR RNA-guided endonuclease Cas9 [Flavisolibacter sp.]|nr:type II CRISPR RNA-guided endonuclease Cas9 [Flavisolibacter sp.]